MAKREVEEPLPRGAPMWIVTFTDMSSLLLTFFILILTFSSTEKETLAKAQGSLQGAFGIVTDMRRSQRDAANTLRERPRVNDDEGVPDEFMRRDQVDDAVKQTQSRKLFDVKIENTVEGKRLVVEPPEGGEHFALLTGALDPRSEQLLFEIGKLFRSLPCRLVVETHVDDRTWRVRRGMTALDWTLQHALDACAVLERAGVPPERVAASPRGDLEPIADNARGELERQRNRRLEILVIPDDADPVWSEAGAN